ncbi:major facilitator superfamily transporter [Xylariales sp. PMI_506]|nr:major facilitator superfamily transporter [Xylariales sp. PMI_506]
MTPAVIIEDVESATEVTTAEWKPSVHQLLIMITLSTISLMVSLDACIIVTSLSAIVSDLGGDTTQGFWIGTSYLLSNAVTMPFTAALSDIFGRPICLIVSLIFFSVGTLLCCLTNTIGQMLIGRCLQGVGGGGVVVLSLVIFTDIVPLRFRPKWYGTVLGAWALGNCIGPIVGGAIVQNTTWRWVFYIMFPFCGFGLVAIPSLLTLKPRTETMVEKLGRVDWVGGGLFMASATLFLVAISWGGVQYDWNSAATLVPLCLGITGLGCVYVWEAKFAKEPFLRPSLFTKLSSMATYFCGAVQGLVIYGQLYYVPFYFLSVKGYTPVHTGLALFPVMFTLVPGSVIVGGLVTRTNNYQWAIWSGWVMLTLGSGLMLMWDVDTSIAQWAVTLVILGFGHGAILNAQNFATQAMCDPGEEGAAAAMYGFLRQFGMALGVGIGGSAFQNIMSLKLKWEGLSTDIAKNSEGFIPELLAMPAGAEKTSILDAYVFGFRGVYAVYVGIAGAALMISLLIKKYDMNKEIATEHKLEDNRVSKMFENRLSQIGTATVSDAESDGKRSTTPDMSLRVR